MDLDLLREISAVEGINIILAMNSCAHQCRYCFFNNHKDSNEHCPDIERKWLDRYLEKYPLKFERQLTYLAMNN